MEQRADGGLIPQDRYQLAVSDHDGCPGKTAHKDADSNDEAYATPQRGMMRP